MPLFYFDVGEAIDDVGVELSDEHAARAEGLRAVAALMCDEARDHEQDMAITIRGPDKTPLLRIKGRTWVEDGGAR